MLEGMRARLRRRRGRVAVVCAVALLGVAVATAHTSVAIDHMGEAAMCLAVLVGGAVVAALPAVAGLISRRRAPLQLGTPLSPPRPALAVPYVARGDPALLQVFRR